MQPIPSCTNVSSSPSSIHRFSMLYDGWWISSGTPSSRTIRAASRVVPGEYDDARVQRFALVHRGREGAHRLLERRVRVEAMRVEDVDVVDPSRPRLWSRLASRYLREPPPCPYGPGHMSHPAFVEMSSSSRYGAKSF